MSDKPEGNWQKFLNTISSHPISAFAVFVVTSTGLFIAYMVIWQTNILSSPTWCAKAMGAEKVAPGSSAQQTLEALKSCNNLLMTQVSAIALDSHINHITLALVIIVLVVVVIAGARAAVKASARDGSLEANVGREEQHLTGTIEGTVTKDPGVTVTDVSPGT